MTRVQIPDPKPARMLQLRHVLTLLWILQIVACVLVELRDAPVQFREATSLLRIAPSAELTVVSVERKQQ
jgi:hypothetical protein